MSVCQITVVGNLGGDPESRDVGGSAVCNFSLAHNYKVKGEDVTIWFRVAAWGKLGEICQQYLGKGSQAAVSGRLRPREYTKDGSDRTSLDIDATDVQFIGKREDGGGSRGSGSSSGGSSAGPVDADSEIPFLCDAFPNYDERRAHDSRW